MKVPTEQKTVHYSRAVSSSKPYDLEASLREVLKSRPNIVDTEVTITGQKSFKKTVRIENRHLVKQGLYLHIVGYTPGLKAKAVTPKVAKKTDSPVYQEAPEGREFQEQECFLRIKGSDIVYLCNGITIQKANAYLQNIVNSQKEKQDLVAFSIAKSFNIKVADYLQKHGVKSIEFNANAFDLEVQSSISSAESDGLFEKTAKVINAGLEGFKKDDTEEQQRFREDLTVTVGLNAKGNSRANFYTRSFIEQYALSLINENETEDGIIIVAGNGKRISGSGVTHSKPYEIIKNENSLQRNSSWTALKTYYRLLVSEGVIEVKNE